MSVNITPKQAEEKLNSGAVLVDVRETWEWEESRDEQAVLIPLGQLVQEMSTLSKDREIVVVCAAGMRSEKAAHILREHNYTAYSIVGGLSAWLGR